jgi:prepilin-type processing-associated H-X9-DG protein
MTTASMVWLRWALASLALVFVLTVCLADRGAADADDAVALAQQRTRSANNLKQIAIAFHDYHDTFGVLPAAAYVDGSAPKNQQLPRLRLDTQELAKSKGEVEVQGRKVRLPLFSWRVAILPFVEEMNLYRQFHLDEPWDSEHNKKLLAKMPKLYAPVRGKTKEPGMTYYQVFTGKDTPFDGMRALKLSGFRDGTANTFLVVEAAEPVPWTKPEDLPYQVDKPLPKLGGLFSNGFHAAFADGHVVFVGKKTPEKTLRAVITPSGGEDVEVPYGGLGKE